MGAGVALSARLPVPMDGARHVTPNAETVVIAQTERVLSPGVTASSGAEKPWTREAVPVGTPRAEESVGDLSLCVAVTDPSTFKEFWRKAHELQKRA